MKYNLVIIGAGLTGIKVALEAHEKGLEDVLVVDHNEQFGGFDQYLFNEPEFQGEKNQIEDFGSLPFEKWPNATVTGFFEAFGNGLHEINVQTKTATIDIEAEHIIICSGGLEKPKEAHKISGTRPAGVMTPSMAINLLERGYLPGEKIMVYENSKITKSLSKLLLHKSKEVIQVMANDFHVETISGKSRVEKVELQNKQNIQLEIHECDSIIFSEGYIPATFFLKGTGINLNNQQFIENDTNGKTSVDNIYALGNCTVHEDVSQDKIKGILQQINQ